MSTEHGRPSSGVGWTLVICGILAGLGNILVMIDRGPTLANAAGLAAAVFILVTGFRLRARRAD